VVQRAEPPEGGLGSPGGPVGGFPPRSNTDREITQAVRAALFLDPDLSQTDFEVSTRDGVVSIAGEVGSEELRQKVLHIVWNIEGVRDVTADVAVV